MKKLFLLLLIVVLFGCVSTSVTTAPEMPGFAKQLNARFWFEMDTEQQWLFLVGMCAGQCEMAMYVNEMEAWQEIVDVQLKYRVLIQGITTYYMATGHFEESVLTVFRIILESARQGNLEERLRQEAMPEIEPVRL